MQSNGLTCNVIDLETSGAMINIFDLSNKNIWRHIIEDIMFISEGKLVTVVVDVESCNLTYCERITKIQKYNYDSVIIG